MNKMEKNLVYVCENISSQMSYDIGRYAQSKSFGSDRYSTQTDPELFKKYEFRILEVEKHLIGNKYDFGEITHWKKAVLEKLHSKKPMNIPISTPGKAKKEGWFIPDFELAANALLPFIKKHTDPIGFNWKIWKRPGINTTISSDITKNSEKIIVSVASMPTRFNPESYERSVASEVYGDDCKLCIIISVSYSGNIFIRDVEKELQQGWFIHPETRNKVSLQRAYPKLKLLSLETQIGKLPNPADNEKIAVEVTNLIRGVI